MHVRRGPQVGRPRPALAAGLPRRDQREDREPGQQDEPARRAGRRGEQASDPDHDECGQHRPDDTLPLRRDRSQRAGGQPRTRNRRSLVAADTLARRLPGRGQRVLLPGRGSLLLVPAPQRLHPGGDVRAFRRAASCSTSVAATASSRGPWCTPACRPWSSSPARKAPAMPNLAASSPSSVRRSTMRDSPKGRCRRRASSTCWNTSMTTVPCCNGWPRYRARRPALPDRPRLPVALVHGGCHQRPPPPLHHEGLARVIQAAGFTVEFSSYLFWPLPLPILLLRAIPSRLGRRPTADLDAIRRELKPPSGPAVQALMAVLDLERRWLARGRRIPIGGSSLLVARRPGGPTSH